MRDDIEALTQYPAARYAPSASPQGPCWSGRCPRMYGVCADRRGSRLLPQWPRRAVGRRRCRGRQRIAVSAHPAAQPYPASRNVVLYFGSGAPGSRAPQGEFDLTRGLVDGGVVPATVAARRSTKPNRGKCRTAGRAVRDRDPGQAFRPDLPDTPNANGIWLAYVERIELYWLPRCWRRDCYYSRSIFRSVSIGGAALPDGTCGHTVKPARLRLRRRLLIYSAPLIVVALVAAAKLISIVVVGNSGGSSFANGDANAVRADAAVLGVANVVEPAKAPFADGPLPCSMAGPTMPTVISPSCLPAPTPPLLPGAGQPGTGPRNPG